MNYTIVAGGGSAEEWGFNPVGRMESIRLHPTHPPTSKGCRLYAWQPKYTTVSAQVERQTRYGSVP